MKNLIAKILIVTLSLYFYAGAETIRKGDEDAEDTMGVDPYASALQENYQTGFVKRIHFFDSMSENFLKMTERMGDLEREGARRDRELREELALVSVDFTTLIGSRNPFRNSKDCGGNLEIARGAPSTIRFPNPGNNQSCVWSLIPQENSFASHRIKFQSLGTEADVVGVAIKYWDSSAKLKSQTVTESRSWISIPAPYVLITYDFDPSRMSSGFEASIVGLGTSEDAANFKPLWFGNSTETINFLESRVYLHPNCTDNPFFANCKLIVKASYCTNRYYSRHCCESCTIAGQLPYSGPHLQGFEQGSGNHLSVSAIQQSFPQSILHPPFCTVSTIKIIILLKFRSLRKLLNEFKRRI